MTETKTYIGTKTITATPMTRAEYNEFRGWTLPENENGDDAGYLVEYEPDGNPNVEGHDGYVSWSPWTVFNTSYRPANNWYERLLIEGDELNKKLSDLRIFIGTDGYATLPAGDRDLLADQVSFMTGYLKILSERRARGAALTAVEAEPTAALEPDEPAAEEVLDPQAGPGDPAAENEAAAE